MSLGKAGFGPTRRLALAALLGAAAYAAFAALAMAIPLSTSLLFFAYQLLAVALPGLALVKLLNLGLTPLESMTASYGLGMGLNIALYFAVAPFGRAELLPKLLYGLAAAGLIGCFLLRRRPLSREADGGEWKIAALFCLFAAAATAVAFSAAYLDPSLVGARYYYHDTLNAVALLTTASWGFPFQFLQMAGTPYYYHAFFYAYASGIKLTLGLSSFEVITKFSLITVSPFLVAAITALGKRVLRDNRLTALAVLFTAVLPTNVFFYYLYIDVLGFPLGLAFAVLAATLFLAAERREGKGLNRLHMVSSAFVLLALGAKGPIAVTLLFSICFALLLQLIRDRNWQVIPKGLTYALPFFALYFFIYRSGADDSMSASPLYSAVRTDFSYWLQELVPTFIWKPLSVLYYTVSQFPIVTLALVLCLIYLFKARKKCPPEPAVDMAVGGTLLGFVFINVFKQIGSSEIYFLNSVIPLAVAAGLLALARLTSLCRRAGRWALPALSALVALSCLPSLISFAGPYISDAVTYRLGGPELVQSQQQIEQLGDRRGAYLTPLEHEAMLWLRDNTPRDAIICDGRYLTNNKWFYGSAFAERAFFLEGYGYVTMEESNDNYPEKVRRDSALQFFYGTEDEGFIPLMRNEGIDYIVVAAYMNPGWQISEQWADKVFENDDVSIYQVKPLEEEPR